MTGNTLSMTVTVKEVGVAALVATSVAVYLTVVTPIGKAKLVSDAAATGPADAAPVRVTLNVATPDPPVLSAAVGGVQECVAVGLPGGVLSVALPGVPVIVGAMTSLTVRVAVRDADPPLLVKLIVPE